MASAPYDGGDYDGYASLRSQFYETEDISSQSEDDYDIMYSYPSIKNASLFSSHCCKDQNGVPVLSSFFSPSIVHAATLFSPSISKTDRDVLWEGSAFACENILKHNQSLVVAENISSRPWEKKNQPAKRFYEPLTGDVCTKIKSFCTDCIQRLDLPDIVLLSQGKTEHDSAPWLPLRYAARYIHVSMRISEFTDDAEEKQKFLDYAKQGLDELIKMQRSSGVFPSPDVRDKGTKFGAFQNKLVAEGLAVAENGWIVEDRGFGGFQHDLGIIGRAFIKGYKVFGDERYLDSAHKAALWLKVCPVVNNWNYNANGAHLLAELYTVKKEQWVLDLLKEKIEQGVLPFQTPSGRWADRHNSRLVYHHILLSSLISTYRQWPHDDEFKGRVKTAVRRAMDYVLRGTVRKGATQSWQAVTNLVKAGAITEAGGEEETALGVHLSKIVSEYDLMHLSAAMTFYRFRCADIKEIVMTKQFEF
jgi:hypothetical protein